MSSPTLIAIPNDPGRVRALQALWPGVGYWDWKALAWVAAPTPACVLPFQAIPGEVPAGETLIAWPVLPPVTTSAVLKLVNLDASGAVVRTEALMTWPD